jgi:hypothetical protein
MSVPKRAAKVTPHNEGTQEGPVLASRMGRT